MRRKLILTTLLLGLGAAAAFRSLTNHPEARMKKLTPVIVVDQVEPCAAFWEQRLAFERTAQVPDGDRLGFVILERDGVELMYQSRAVMGAEAPPAVTDPPIQLFIEVRDLDAVECAMQGAIVLPRHDTFYGMTEFNVRDPAGTLVIFAQPTAQS